MRRQFQFLSVSVLCLGIASAVTASVTRIDIVPDVPIVVGNDLDYTIVHTLPAYAWSAQRRCLESDPPGAWTPDPAEQLDNNIFTYPTQRVGTRDFRGGAFEEIVPPGDPQNPAMYEWHYLTKQVTVIGPDRDTFTGPLDSYVEDFFLPKYAIDVRFPVLAGTIPIGPNFEGYPQERIRRPQLNYDSGWIGPTEGVFCMDGSSIFDHKAVSGPGWANILIGSTIDDLYHQNRMVIFDCTGAAKYFTLTERHFRFVKTDEISWQLVEVID